VELTECFSVGFGFDLGCGDASFPQAILAAPQSRWSIAITVSIWCGSLVAARLSQNVSCHDANAGATPPIAAPAIVNWP